MTKPALTGLLALVLLGCVPKEAKVASPPAAVPAKPDATVPAEAAPEKAAAPPVDLTPVPFETARANFIRDTSQRYGIPAAEIEATLSRAQFLDSVVAAMVHSVPMTKVTDSAARDGTISAAASAPLAHRARPPAQPVWM